MSKVTRKVAGFVENNLEWFLLGGFILAGLVIRVSFKEVLSLDMTGDFVPWTEEIGEMSFGEMLRTPVGNYSSLYQIMLFIISRIPLLGIPTRIKAVSVLFDLALAVLAFVIAQKEFKNRLTSVLISGLVFLSPIVFLNSAAWGQCDSIYAFFAVFSLYLLWKEKYVWSFVLLGVSLMWKLQAVFVLPVFLLMYIRDKKWSLLHFLIVPAVMFLLYLPNLIAGRPLSMLLGVYSSQTGILSESIYINFSNFFALFVADQEAIRLGGFATYGSILFAVAVLAVIVVVALRKRRPDTLDDFVFLTVILVEAAVLFMPKMHDRYGYLAEVLLMVLAVRNRKTILPAAVLYAVTLFHYGLCLFKYTAMPLYVATILHLGAFAVLTASYFAPGFLKGRQKAE